MGLSAGGPCPIQSCQLAVEVGQLAVLKFASWRVGKSCQLAVEVGQLAVEVGQLAV